MQFHCLNLTFLAAAFVFAPSLIRFCFWTCAK